MNDPKKVTAAIYEAIDDVNYFLPKGSQLKKSPKTVLFGKSGKLDSLEFINFIVAAEQKIVERIGVTVTLADEKAMSQKNNPFRTVSTLSNYIAKLLKKR